MSDGIEGQVRLLHEGHDLRYHEVVTELYISTVERVEEDQYGIRCVVRDGCADLADDQVSESWVWCNTCECNVPFEEVGWK